MFSFSVVQRILVSVVCVYVEVVEDGGDIVEEKQDAC